MNKNSATKPKTSYAVECSLSKYYGYAHYISGIKPINRLYIKNACKQTLNNAVLEITSENSLLSFKREIPSIPYESTVDIEVNAIRVNTSPLINIKEQREISISVTLFKDEILCSFTSSVTLLPFDTYCGIEAYPELLSCFVNPYTQDFEKLLKSASDTLRGWKYNSALNGYEDTDRNGVKLITAALYKALQQRGLKYEQTSFNLALPVNIKPVGQTLEEKKATVYGTTLLFASLAEAAGLNSIIINGQKTSLVGIWLNENCFLESSFDEVSEITKRCDVSINDIDVIDVSGLFEDNKKNFAMAEKSALLKLAENDITTIIDVKRCRIAGYRALPQRIASEKGWKLLENEEKSEGDMPNDKKKALRPLKLKLAPTKESQWERRLLDLSLKNSMLNFLPKNNMLHIMATSAADTASLLLDNREYSLLEMPSELMKEVAAMPNFNVASKLKPLTQLITLEQKNGRLRTFCDSKSLTQYASALYRKEKLLSEETGTSTLYAACGFLKWNYIGTKDEYKYAPLVLIPLSLKKKAAGKGFDAILREDEIQFNATLAEFLKQEFGIEMRGIENIKADEIESVLTAVKRHTLSYKGWEVTDDVYITSLSFTRFFMWNDIRVNIDTFKKNKIVGSLLANRLNELLVYKDKPSKEKEDIFLPVTADESQFDAVKLSDKNVSFILHGPPGTGKSQTITNIIANALAKNKRVLFVAEKQAALSVVKKRLDAIGIGDFCLELHSDKSAKNEVCGKLYETSRLANERDSGYAAKLKQFKELKEAVKQPLEALHKRRRLGISIYEGILKLREYRLAPDILNIDSLFYEKLTPEKLSVYESLLSELVSVSKECGGLYRSPFENVGLTEYDDILIPNVITSQKILVEESRHLKAYTQMCVDVLGGNLRVVTKKKLLILKELCLNVVKENNPYKKLFENVKGLNAVKVLNVFINVYKDFEASEKAYNKLFKSKIELPASVKSLREELEIFPVEFYKSKPLKALIKKMNKAAIEKIRPEDMRESIDTVLYYQQKKDETAEAGEKLSEIIGNGKVDYNQVAEFILGLDVLYNYITKIFVNYDRITFNLMLENLFTKYPAEIFTGFLNAFDSFEKARKHFFSLLKIEKDYNDLGEDYAEYISLKASSIKDNIDMLSGWCRFNLLCEMLKAEGLKFILTPITEGKVNGEQITACLYKKIYSDFVQREIEGDETLSKFSSAITEENIDKFRLTIEEFERITQAEIRHILIEKLPSPSTEGALSLELVRLQRAYKSNMRGLSVRSLILSIQNLFGLVAPCILTSPGAVAKYLDPTESFDLVVFDEASQIPTAEAIGSIARAKNAVIVGDPKQLPPTSFFITDYTDEENLQFEDLESILEDCLALGLTERYLKWHYRSKHESLIAFSNAMYYDNRLCTFPSTDALQSKLQFRYIENGVYDRGRTKQNIIEADALIAEVIKRLKDEKSRKQSIGIVTFSSAQQTLIENRLSDALIKNKLESVAYERDEPLFVKNLENVQGDERDVILFSICYGPDKYGKLSLNFGPVNQANGWRRLNVAASRAREEMIIYSSITSAMIDLSKNNSKGVAGLKAFLEFAGNGKNMLAVKQYHLNKHEGIGKFIAADLEELGYECRCDLGVSDFKVDVAVLDPQSGKFILAIICDSKPQSVNDVQGDTVMQIKTLKRLDWNVYRLWTLNYINNSSREIKKLKQYLDKILGKYGTKNDGKFAKPYIEATLKEESLQYYYILEENNEKDIISRLSTIIEAEQPVSREYLIKKCLYSYGITRTGTRINARMLELTDKLTYKNETINGTTFYRKDDNALKCNFYRKDDNIKLKRTPMDISPYEYIAAAKSVLAERISLYIPDLVKEIAAAFDSKVTAESDSCIRNSISYASEKGILTTSINGMVTV